MAGRDPASENFRQDKSTSVARFEIDSRKYEIGQNLSVAGPFLSITLPDQKGYLSR